MGGGGVYSSELVYQVWELYGIKLDHVNIQLCLINLAIYVPFKIWVKYLDNLGPTILNGGSKVFPSLFKKSLKKNLCFYKCT